MTQSPLLIALAEYQQLFGPQLVDACPTDPDTAELLPAVTIVTDNGGPFRFLNFELFITSHPELRHARNRMKTSGKTSHVNVGSAP